MPIDTAANAILGLPRSAKRSVAMVADGFLCALAVWLAFYLRLDEWVVLEGVQWLAVAVSILLALPIFIVAGLYRAIFRYSGPSGLARIAQAAIVYGVVYATIFTFIQINSIPRTVGIIQPVLLFLFVASSRVLASWWLGGAYTQLLKRHTQQNVMIYGAGHAGRQLYQGLASTQMRVVGFLDDDSRLHGRLLFGRPIYPPSQLENLVERYRVTDLLLAIPSAGRRRRNEILTFMRSLPVAVRTVPGLTDVAQGRVETSEIRELDLDDLLGREAVAPDQELLERNIRGKVVLVTGAGGSIGSELCRQIVRLKPATLLLVERSEAALYAIHDELVNRGGDNVRGIQLVPLLASVYAEERMRGILSAWRPDTIYHAAAYKHVPLVEHNPIEGVWNNVFGTLALATAAQEAGVGNFVLISTDKAVRPTNVMGASKRLAEMVLQALAQSCRTTCYSMVRFGNVLGSSGSVVPLFRRQIRSGGPITLTHKEITRYFMTIPEAAQLVVQAGAMATGGEVFVLDMGEPVRIADLARRMVQLSGLTIRDPERPDGDIEITEIGLRPGEKLYEELLIGDNPSPTAHPRIMKANEDFMPWQELQWQLNTLRRTIESSDVREVMRLMRQLVPEYASDHAVLDWVHLQSDAG